MLHAFCIFIFEFALAYSSKYYSLLSGSIFTFRTTFIDVIGRHLSFVKKTFMHFFFLFYKINYIFILKEIEICNI